MTKSHVIAGLAIAVMGMLIVAVPVFGLADTVLQYGETLRTGNPSLIGRYYPLLLLIYFLLYATSVALCLPLAALMAVAGGWFFGLWSLPVAVLSIVAGSIAPFLLARRYAGRALTKIDSAMVDRFRKGFDRNQFQWLLLMRLLPWAPFTVTTIVAGALGMETTKFLIGTALGFLPAGLAFNAIGHGLAHLTDMHSISAMQLYRDPDFLMAIAGVSAVALIGFLRKLPVLTRFFG